MGGEVAESISDLRAKKRISLWPKQGDFPHHVHPSRCEFPAEADPTVAGKRVIEALMEGGVDGMMPGDLPIRLNMESRHINYILRRLELQGHVFQKGKCWVATDAVLRARFDPKPYIERMRAELEKALFGMWGELPERVRIVFREFSAAKSLPTPMTDSEALRFAQQRALKTGV